MSYFSPVGKIIIADWPENDIREFHCNSNRKQSS